MYQQCKLTREQSERLSWLDTTKIKIGSVITLKDETERWTVSDIYDKQMSKDEVREMERHYTSHRKGSDI